MRLRIHDDYTIHFPIQVCEPLNADFDGDTVSIQLVPPEAAEETYERMSPLEKSGVSKISIIAGTFKNRKISRGK